MVTALMKREPTALMETPRCLVISAVSVRGHRFTRTNDWLCEHCGLPRSATADKFAWQIPECAP